MKKYLIMFLMLFHLSGCASIQETWADREDPFKMDIMGESVQSPSGYFVNLLALPVALVDSTVNAFIGLSSFETDKDNKCYGLCVLVLPVIYFYAPLGTLFGASNYHFISDI